MNNKINNEQKPIPLHVAIILDGNGRWAKKRGLPRVSGHLKGVQNIKRIINKTKQIGIKYLSLFCFSTENWNRSADEVNYLMNLGERVYQKNRKKLMTIDEKIRVIGEITNLTEKQIQMINDVNNTTQDHQGLEIIIAFNYGSKQEIIRATKNMIRDVINEKLEIDKINCELFETYLDTNGVPPVDLLIRTSGEERLSNFLLWQNAYSELYFTKKYWPSFNPKDLDQAIIAYQNRQRRFGK